MRKLNGVWVAWVVMLSGLVGTAGAAGPIDFEVTADFFGKYIWRGQNLSDDPVFQTGVTAAYGNFTFGLWGNMDTTTINGNSGDFSELDYSLDYSAPFPGLEGIGYSVGVIYYGFPGTKVPDTTELYWGLNFDLPLNPTVTVYHDLDEAEGSYIAFGASHSIEKLFEIGSIPVGCEIGAGLGLGSGSYNKYYWGTDQWKSQDLSFSVAFPFSLGPVRVSPSLNYVTLLSDDIRDADVYDDASDYFFAGVGLTYRF